MNTTNLAALAQASAPIASGQDRKKILLCDDDDILVDILESVLETAGYKVVVAADGLECVERFQAEKPDMMIIDLDMPRRGGFAVIDQLRRKGVMNGCALVIMSGRENKKDRDRADASGVVDYMVKPFNVTELIKQVNSAIV